MAQVAEKDAPHLGRHPNPTNIVGMVNSNGWLYTPGGVAIQNSPSMVRDLQSQDRELVSQGRQRVAIKDWMRSQQEYMDGGNLLELFEEIGRQRLVDDVVFVDLTANDLTSFHQRVIDSGGKIVTANKIPVAQSSWDIFKLLTQFRRRYGFSCSVMAGAGAVPFLRDAFDTSDTVKSIEGCFSGTLGKLCNLLYEGEITFSEAVKQLKLGGDTEPDPRDDLSGMDVAKKIVILARTAGYHVDLKDVDETKGFLISADQVIDNTLLEVTDVAFAGDINHDGVDDLVIALKKRLLENPYNESLLGRDNENDWFDNDFFDDDEVTPQTADNSLANDAANE